MMLDSKELVTELDAISKLTNLDTKDIDSLMLEIGLRIIAILKIERVNVWLFNEDKSCIKSVSEYDLRTKKFSKDNVIPRSIGPKYFQSVERNKILIVPDVYKSEFTAELINSYLIPFNIVSLMDVPLRISGELVGVICFEKTGDIPKEFTEREQSFALSVSIVLASILEAKFNKDVKSKFAALVTDNLKLQAQNEVLNNEIANRSNISLQLLNFIASNLKSHNSNLLSDEYSFQIEKYLKRIVTLNEIISSLSNKNKLLAKDFVLAIIKKFESNDDVFSKSIKYFMDNEVSEMDYSKALNIGLIIFEIIENSIQYSYTNQFDFVLIISLTNKNAKSFLSIGNNGHQFDFDEQLKLKTFGLNLMMLLSKDSLESFQTPLISNQHYELVF